MQYVPTMKDCGVPWVVELQEIVVILTHGSTVETI